MKSIPVRHINSATHAQNNTGRFSIRDLQQVLKGKDLVHDLHRHDFFFILAVQKGEGVHEIDFVEYKVNDNHIFILRPGQVHRLELKGDTTGFLIEFDLNFYQPKNRITAQRWKIASNKNICEADTDTFTKLHSFLSILFYEFTNRKEGYEDVIKAILEVFFIEHTRQSRSAANTVLNGNGYNQERFESFIHLLETSIASTKTVTQFASLLNLSPFQLNTITKTAVGKTVSELINEQIILEAKRYLLATSSQVKDVADQLGYEDVAYFIRFFKKHTGYTPQVFRRNFK